MSGFYLMHRGWMDNPIFRDEAFTERTAWIWLIEEAAWKPVRKRAGASIVTLGRGQLIGSVRYLAEAWAWSKSRVDRYLARLICEKMIGTDAGTGTNIITICNYDKYQVQPDDERDEVGTAAGQQRDSSGTNKKEDKEVKEEDSSAVAVAPSPDPRRVIFGDIATWLASETKRSLASVKSWLAKAANVYGDGALIDAFSRIRAGPFQNDWISALTAELKRTSNVRQTAQTPVVNMYAGSAIAVARRRAKRSADRGAGDDAAQPLLDGGGPPRIASAANGGLA